MRSFIFSQTWFFFLHSFSSPRSILQQGSGKVLIPASYDGMNNTLSTCAARGIPHRMGMTYFIERDQGSLSLTERLFRSMPAMTSICHAHVLIDFLLLFSFLGSRSPVAVVHGWPSLRTGQGGVSYFFYFQPIRRLRFSRVCPCRAGSAQRRKGWRGSLDKIPPVVMINRGHHP